MPQTLRAVSGFCVGLRLRVRSKQAAVRVELGHTYFGRFLQAWVDFLHARQQDTCKLLALVSRRLPLILACLPACLPLQLSLLSVCAVDPRRGAKRPRQEQKPYTPLPKYNPFRPTQAVAFDLFPHTAHTEVVVLFERD